MLSYGIVYTVTLDCTYYAEGARVIYPCFHPSLHLICITPAGQSVLKYFPLDCAIFGTPWISSLESRPKTYVWVFSFGSAIWRSPAIDLDYNKIQFNSKTLYKDGDPVSLQL